jgi:hypothetical protein
MIFIPRRTFHLTPKSEPLMIATSSCHRRFLWSTWLIVCSGICSAIWGGQKSLQAESPAEVLDRSRVTYLNQGWTSETRHDFYYLTQGSHLVPYEWFLHLERHDREELFRGDAHMEQLRFIVQAPQSPRNPDGLPIGFALDDNPTTVNDGSMYRLQQAFLPTDAARANYPRTNRWLGFTCAACHTAEVECGEQRIRIDGGPAMADIEQFLVRLAAAVEATWRDEARLTRFADRLLGEQLGEQADRDDDRAVERERLKEELANYSLVLAQLVRRSKGTTPYGFARLDAFGAILNEICETGLGIPENHHPADAPASFPQLWDTPRLDWVQWNGSAGNPIARNVGQVLGVFGQLRLDTDPPADQFRSTVRIDNLDRLEQFVQSLKSPRWPESLGELDENLVSQGKLLYQHNCQSCHHLPDESTGEYPQIQIGEKQFLRTRMVPVDQIGTDPQLADHFIRRRAKPGVLASRLPAPFGEFEQVPRAVLLGVAVQGVIERNATVRNMTPEQLAALRAYRPQDDRPPEVWAYKARPLNGIWATAPYLHNGSVPTLYHLLLPEYERPTTFHVGSRRFDPRLVGFDTSPESGTFRFRVHDERGRVIPGNSNAGHSGRFYTHVRNPDGTLREFTDAERWALVEFLKSL